MDEMMASETVHVNGQQIRGGMVTAIRKGTVLMEALAQEAKENAHEDGGNTIVYFF